MPALLAPPVDDATRRQFIALLGAAGLLTACGSDTTPPDVPGAATRSVDHTAGTAEVPVAPQRVVAIDYSVAVALIALGLTPIAVPSELEVFLEPVAELLPNPPQIADTATTDAYEVNVEAIAAAGPDVVLGTDQDADSYDLLAAVAPTVLVEYGTNGGWRQRFRAVADAVGRTEQRAEVETAYEEMIADLPAAAGETTVAFVRENDGSLILDGAASGFAGSVAARCGRRCLRSRTAGC